MDLEFLGNVAAVGDDGVDRDAEMGGDFLVGHTLYKGNDYFLLAGRECLMPGDAVLENHIGDVAGHVAVLDESL